MAQKSPLERHRLCQSVIPINRSGDANSAAFLVGILLIIDVEQMNLVEQLINRNKSKCVVVCCDSNFRKFENSTILPCSAFYGIVVGR